MTTVAQWFSVARDVIEVRGPDARKFLQGQVSQDVLALAEGDSAWSFILQPAGKVEALIRVWRTEEDVLVVDTDAGFGEATMARINRFKLRTKADVTMLPWKAIAVRGAAEVPAGSVVGWPGPNGGFDLLGPDPVPPTTAVEGSAAEYERLRIEAGWPAMGAELTADTIPGESGLVPITASFTKGCYTGQELVARIDSRGNNVPRHLRQLQGAGLVAGDHLLDDGAEVGWVTSVAGDLGLGYVARKIEGAAKLVSSGGEPVLVTPITTHH